MSEFAFLYTVMPIGLIGLGMVAICIAKVWIDWMEAREAREAWDEQQRRAAAAEVRFSPSRSV